MAEVVGQLQQLEYHLMPRQFVAMPLLFQVAAVNMYLLGIVPIGTVVLGIKFSRFESIPPALAVMYLGVTNGVLWLYIGRRVFGERFSRWHTIFQWFVIVLMGIYGPLNYCEARLEEFALTFSGLFPIGGPPGWLPPPVPVIPFWVGPAIVAVGWARAVSLGAFIGHVWHVAGRLQRWSRLHPDVTGMRSTARWWTNMSIGFSIFALVPLFSWTLDPQTLGFLFLLGFLGLGISLIAAIQAGMTLAGWQQTIQTAGHSVVPP